MRKNIVVYFLIIILPASCFTTAHASNIEESYRLLNNETSLQKNINQYNITDVPHWNISDFWVYEVDIHSDTSKGLFDISSNDLTLTVTDSITMVHQNKNEKIYVLELTGNISGTFESSILIGDVTGIVNGKISLRQADLSLITSNVSLSGIIEYLIIFESDFEMNSIAEFYSSFEYFDFPIKTNEEWNISTSAYLNSSFYVEDFYDNASESYSSNNGYAQCLGMEDVSVDAGLFSTFHLLSEQENGSIESWYGPEVKNIVKLYMKKTNNTDTSMVWLNVSSYSLNSQQVNISANFSSDLGNVGESISISGYVNEAITGIPIQNTNLSIYISYTNKTYNIKTDKTYNIKTDNNGFYSLSFTVPLILDSTKTNYDIGSDGVIISVNDSNYYGDKISTLTVIGLAVDNVRLYQDIITGNHSVNITCNIYKVENLTDAIIHITGPAGFSPINTTLYYARNNTYYYNQTYLVPGVYNYFIWAKDTLGNINNTPVYSFEIVNIFIADAGGPYYSITGKEVQVSGNAYHGVKPYNWTWYDGYVNYYSQNPVLIYNQIGEYTITLMVRDAKNNSAMDSTIVYITDENLPPSIAILKPKNYIYFNDTEIIPFSIPLIIGDIQIIISASDEESEISRVDLFIDNILMKSFSNEPYTWTWNLFSFGNHTIKVVAYDESEKNTSVEIDVWKFL